MNYVRLTTLIVFILLSACRDTEAPTQPGAPIITDLTADPETVAPGETSTITWTVLGDNVELIVETDERRPITVTGETSYVAHPTVTTRYVLIAKNEVARVQDEVVVNVTPASPETP